MKYPEPDLEVFQGDSIALAYRTDPEQDMSLWSTRIMVKRQLTEAALLEQDITQLSPDNLRMVGLMQTASLEPGKYWLLAEMSNATTGESKEIHQRISIKPQGVF